MTTLDHCGHSAGISFHLPALNRAIKPRLAIETENNRNLRIRQSSGTGATAHSGVACGKGESQNLHLSPRFASGLLADFDDGADCAGVPTFCAL